MLLHMSNNLEWRNHWSCNPYRRLCFSTWWCIYRCFSNCDEYYDEFVQALQISDEKGWRLPLDPEYFEKLKSTSADFKNSAGKPGGGASVAANFLEAFIEEGTQWLHLDIAGSADNDGTGATGAMIRSVVNMINLKTIVKKWAYQIILSLFFLKH